MSPDAMIFHLSQMLHTYILYFFTTITTQDYPMYKFPTEQESDTTRPASRRLEDVVPYGIKLVQAPDLWSAERKPKPVKICIVDTGYDITHDDLPSEGVTSSNTRFEDAFSDGDGHGTHIAGIIGALGNAGGVIGGMSIFGYFYLC
jgi:subtilisin family serine protease